MMNREELAALSKQAVSDEEKKKQEHEAQLRAETPENFEETLEGVEKIQAEHFEQAVRAAAGRGERGLVLVINPDEVPGDELVGTSRVANKLALRWGLECQYAYNNWGRYCLAVVSW